MSAIGAHHQHPRQLSLRQYNKAVSLPATHHGICMKHILLKAAAQVSSNT